MVGTHFIFQPELRQLLLEELLQPGFSGRIAASPGIPGRTLVSANKDMLFKFRHQPPLTELFPPQFRDYIRILPVWPSALASVAIRYGDTLR